MDVTLNPRQIQKLEVFARQHPKAYRRKVGWYVALGYGSLLGYVGGCGLLCLLCLYFGGSGYLTHWLTDTRLAGNFLIFGLVGSVIFGVLAFLSFQFIVKEIDPPNGIILRRAQAPKLFTMLDQMCARSKVAKIDYVLFDQRFSASVCQHTNMIGFGKSQSYLILGLPLLEAVSPEQLQAIVAHELGHLAGNDSEFASYIYGMRQTWGRLLDYIQSGYDTFLVLMLPTFLRWYVPQFLTYTFVLGRLDEYRADEFSGKLTSKKMAGEALIQVYLLHYVWDYALNTVAKQANHQPQVPTDIFSQVLAVLRQPLPQDLQQQFLQQSLDEKTGFADTHPCLSDRLAALGFQQHEQIQPPIPVAVSAAERFLGPLWPKLKAQSDQIWASNFSDGWQRQYKYFQEVNARLESLAVEARTNLSDALTYARKTAEWLGPEEAVPAYLALLDRDPNHLEAHQEVAVILMNLGDDRGIEHLEQVMQLDPAQTKSICEALKSHFLAQGNQPMAKHYNDRLIERSRQQAQRSKSI